MFPLIKYLDLMYLSIIAKNYYNKDIAIFNIINLIKYLFIASQIMHRSESVRVI